MSKKPEPNNHKQRLGNWGESVAATHLKAHGYKILQTNWRCKRGEIDIVAQRKGVYHFVEVKTRRGRQHGTPEEAITPRKANQLLMTAQLYIGHFDLDDADWQVDLVALELDSQGKLIRCEHIPNILY